MARHARDGKESSLGKEKEGLYQWLRDIEVRLREREMPRRT